MSRTSVHDIVRLADVLDVTFYEHGGLVHTTAEVIGRRRSNDGTRWVPLVRNAHDGSLSIVDHLTYRSR